MLEADALQTTLERWRRTGHLIRTGETPDACHQIHNYFYLTQMLAQGKSAAYQRSLYTRVYTNLIDVVCDCLIERHWRLYCLELVYVPLRALYELAATEEQRQDVQCYRQETRVLSHYFLSP